MDINKRFEELCKELGNICLTINSALKRKAEIETECEVIRNISQELIRNGLIQGPTLVKENESLSK